MWLSIVFLIGTGATGQALTLIAELLTAFATSRYRKIIILNVVVNCLSDRDRRYWAGLDPNSRVAYCVRNIPIQKNHHLKCGCQLSF
jgi:hypothetical protein